MSYTMKTAAVLMIVASGSWAQDSAATQPPWLIGCSNQINSFELVCEMSQSIVLAEGNQRLATAGFVKTAEADVITGSFTLPVGLFLPAGLSVSVDSATLGSIGFESCDAQGCYANTDVSEDWVSAMKAGSTLTLDIQRLDQEVLSLGFDLAGFGDVLAVMP